jgi:hypothetical protein
MPKRKTHEVISRLLLGQSYPNVDRGLDWPVKFMGRSHRKLFHTIPESIIIGLLLTGDVKGAMAGVLHVVTDTVDSGAKKKIGKLINNRSDKGCRKKRKQ